MSPRDAPALSWNAGALEHRLQALHPGLQLEVLASVDSTNTRLLERLRHDADGAVLLVAEEQTQGRGRNGRRWQSQPGGSLTFSLGLPFGPADWSGLSLAVGVALAEAIEPLGADRRARLQLKWPNDLWLADTADPASAPLAWGKLGGILIETVATGSGQRACVVGVGLNVLPRDEQSELSSGYACVHALDAQAAAPRLLAQVAPPLLAALHRFEREGLAPFATSFARRDLLRGLPVGTTLAAVPQGVADGVDAHGALRVRHAGGVALVSSGEVSVRPLMAADGQRQRT